MGKVSRVNSDGTFDIAYDDGDRERRVSERNVRAQGGSVDVQVHAALGTIEIGCFRTRTGYIQSLCGL